MMFTARYGSIPRWIAWSVLTGALLGPGGVCRADRFQLKDGRVLTGRLVHTDTITEDDREVSRLAIEIEPGVLIRIYESDLVRNGHWKTDPRELEYRQKVANLPDTVEAHSRAAQWCSQQGLQDLARAHMLRIIDLEPDHKEARSAVKHTLSASSGRWIKREDQMSERGKVFHQGRWKFPEYIPMDEGLERETKEKAALQKEITRWHSDAVRGAPEKARQALESLSQLDNPLVIDYLAQLLLDKQKAGQPPATVALKQVYIGVLSKFAHPLAAMPLAHCSVLDAEANVRAAALDALARRGREAAIPVLVGYLRNPSNPLVNRAAFALGRLDAHEAIMPLIEALATRHEFQANSNTTYAPGAGGLAVGGPKKQIRELENDAVRAALAQLTGQGQLGFDKPRWKAWYASIATPPVDDLRRDL